MVGFGCSISWLMNLKPPKGLWLPSNLKPPRGLLPTSLMVSLVRNIEGSGGRGKRKRKKGKGNGSESGGKKDGGGKRERKGRGGCTLRNGSPPDPCQPTTTSVESLIDVGLGRPSRVYSSSWIFSRSNYLWPSFSWLEKKPKTEYR